jgi:hypothetical protein
MHSEKEMMRSVSINPEEGNFAEIENMQHPTQLNSKS